MRRIGLTALLAGAALSAVACGSSSSVTHPETAAVPATTNAATTTTASKPAATEPTATTAPATTTVPTATVATTRAVASTEATTTVGTVPPPPPTEPGATARVVQQSLCPSEQKSGILVVFGHRRTAAAASRLSARAAAAGFASLLVQRRACRDFAVVLPGLATIAQARAFRREADAAGFRVTLDCRSHPVEGGLAAVFGHRPTKRAAEELRARATARGFAGLRVQEDRCGDWEVDLYGIKIPAQRAEFGREARAAGFRIVFEVG